MWRELIPAEASLDLGQHADPLEPDDDHELAGREGADLGVAVLGGDVPAAARVIDSVALVAELGSDDVVRDLDRDIEREPRLAKADETPDLR